MRRDAGIRAFMKPHGVRRARGFTLIEVIVALFVVALGLGALLATLTSSADAIGHLRNKSFAQWIALNRISEVRLSGIRPAVGQSDGELQYAGATWRWQQQVSDPGIAGMLRIDVAVAPAGAGAKPSMDRTGAVEGFAALGSAFGFFGTSVAAPNGFDPDWSVAAAAGQGPGGADGGGGAPPPRQPTR
jgi:general secretion pathway protein I